MKLRLLEIHNYRSVRHVELAAPDMVILLGPNNHGKSNILSALEFGLAPSSKPIKDDFFAVRDDRETSIWVEMTFGDLTEQEQTTFQKYVRTDNTVKVRKTARLQAGDSVDISYNGYVQEPDQWWLKASAFQRLSSRERVQHESEEVPELALLLEGEGRITQRRVFEFQEAFIQAHRADLTFTETLEETSFLGTKNVAGGILPDFYLVPAVRDLNDEAKVKGTTVFGKLLQRAVKDMAERDPRFVELRDGLRRLVGELNMRPEGLAEEASELGRVESSLDEELSSWNVKVSIEVTPPEIEKIFELGTTLHLDDGLKTLAERKGHGLQRAVLFALLRAWAKLLRTRGDGGRATARQASESAYFAIEEPELFLHPHAQRQLFASLSEIASARDYQVFICTHSTHFIDMEKYRQIALVTKPNPEVGTHLQLSAVELFQGEEAAERKRHFHMAYWVNPDRAEMFFARKVILTEGETEKVLFPFLAQKLNCFDPNVSVIDCGNKYNLKLYMAILNAFLIPYCVVHDEDPLLEQVPADWTPEKRAAAQRLFQANEDIARLVQATIGHTEVLSPDFEGVGGISHTQANKKGKAIAALDHFDQMTGEQIPARLADAIRAAYQIADVGVP